MPVTDENCEWYRQQFSAFFYDFYLFERLIDIDQKLQPEIQNYLKLLEIVNKIARSISLMNGHQIKILYSKKYFTKSYCQI